ncbi:hypothetical protein, partial [Amycolatopsis sp. NPDC003676]
MIVIRRSSASVSGCSFSPTTALVLATKSLIWVSLRPSSPRHSQQGSGLGPGVAAFAARELPAYMVPSDVVAL